MAQSPLAAASEESLVEETHFPDKAVVFDRSPETTLDDYFAGISKIIDPGNVTHASHIRGDRVCMFFREEHDIKTLLKEGGLDIKDSFAHCKRFHAEPSKVILSNCLPFISNKKLVETLSRIGTVTSPITDVFVNTELDNFKHVRSFRKTVEMLFPNLDDVPYKVMVEYRTKSVPIYICVENLLCVSCRLYGHCAAHCPLREAPSHTLTSPSKEAEVGKRPRAKSAPAKRLSSPITSFFCRHAATLSRDQGLTSSIDFSRESVWSISPKDEDVLNVPPSSDEDVGVVSEEKKHEVIYEERVSARTEPRTFMNFPPMTSECRTCGENPLDRRIVS